ncbi:MAG: Sec-independent protein translocase protein TatB [Actinomycetota bacterium]|nr:Sec-independent protein translocase protein TatB [Actinomycetota bacterium]
MFNIQGSELVFLLLIALLVLGPEKLPDAIRKFTRTYAEFKKMAGGFQGELRQALDEPMRELRSTADAVRQAATFDPDDTTTESTVRPAATERPKPLVSEIAPRSPELNFGDPAARRAAAAARDSHDPSDGEATE